LHWKRGIALLVYFFIEVCEKTPVSPEGASLLVKGVRGKSEGVEKKECKELGRRDREKRTSFLWEKGAFWGKVKQSDPRGRKAFAGKKKNWGKRGFPALGWDEEWQRKMVIENQKSGKRAEYLSKNPFLSAVCWKGAA